MQVCVHDWQNDANYLLGRPDQVTWTVHSEDSFTVLYEGGDSVESSVPRYIHSVTIITQAIPSLALMNACSLLLYTVEPGCQVHNIMLMEKRAASWALHIQGCL